MIAALELMNYFSPLESFVAFPTQAFSTLRSFWPPTGARQQPLSDKYDTVVPPPSAEELIIKSLPPLTTYKPPKYPIVLCHGLSGFDKLILVPSVRQLVGLLQLSIREQKNESFMEDTAADEGLLALDYWVGVSKFLESKGCTVITAKVPSFGSIEDRASVLDQCINRGIERLRQGAPDEVQREWLDSDGKFKINLIAHSMGGLDGRYLISKKNDKNYHVMSLTTIATPHRGSEMADFVVEKFDSFKQTASLDEVPLFLPPAFYQLTTYYMKYFNSVTPDDPNVSYFSYGSFFYPKWYNVFYPSWNIIFNRSGGEPNDGLVTVKSAQWGRYLGTLEKIDHLDIINWRNKLQLETLTNLEMYNKGIKKLLSPELDVLDFYLAITDMLARNGL
ncbi:AaceriAFR650Wp [[Ashbya] aceris (nom. inval.)]|nr:AaceriAFR650Wp [[Ashbya] aceris (nom. inval.)]